MVHKSAPKVIDSMTGLSGKIFRNTFRSSQMICFGFWAFASKCNDLLGMNALVLLEFGLIVIQKVHQQTTSRLKAVKKQAQRFGVVYHMHRSNLPRKLLLKLRLNNLWGPNKGRQTQKTKKAGKGVKKAGNSIVILRLNNLGESGNRWK